MAIERDTTVVKHEDDDVDDDFSDDDDIDAGAANNAHFEPGTSLPYGAMQRHRLDHLMTLVEGPYMDLNPDYQREVVWNGSRMSGLIDSLLENYYIPPVIFNCTRAPAVDGSDEPRWKRTCVDGKQRISSIHAFMKGQIPCHDKRGQRWYFCIAPGARTNRQILPTDVIEAFKRKEINSFEFFGLTREQEEDLFARVQLGVSLNPAEKMRATSGPWQEFARMFEEDFHPIMNLLRSRARSAGFRLYLQCFAQILEVQHPTNANGKPSMKTTIAAVGRMLDNPRALDDATKAHLATVFTTFNELVLERPQVFKDNGYATVKTFAPLELVAVAVLISVYGDRRNHELLLGDIKMMREHLRRSKEDLQLNGRCWKNAWDFIDELEQFRGATDTDLQVSKKLASTDVMETTPASAESAKRATKPAVSKTPSETAMKKSKTPSRSTGRTVRGPLAVVADPPTNVSSQSTSDTPTGAAHDEIFVIPNHPASLTMQPKVPSATLDSRLQRNSATHYQRAVQEPSEPTPESSAVKRETFGPLRTQIHRQFASGRMESPSIFVRSVSPDSIIQIDSDSDADSDFMTDAPPPAPPADPFGTSGSLQFSSARRPSEAAPTAPPPQHVAPMATMAPMASHPKPKPRSKATASLFTPEKTQQSETHNRRPSIPNPNYNPTESRKSVSFASPIPDETQTQAPLSQTRFSLDSSDEGEVVEIERERQSLLAEFRTERTTEAGAMGSRSAGSSDDSEDTDLPISRRKRRADASLERRGGYGKKRVR